MRQQAQFFILALKGEPTPLCTAADAVKDLHAAMQYMHLLRREQANPLGEK
jgi:hypothetical protein